VTRLDPALIDLELLLAKHARGDVAVEKTLRAFFTSLSSRIDYHYELKLKSQETDNEHL
jgi:hypothetical protein